MPNTEPAISQDAAGQAAAQQPNADPARPVRGAPAPWPAPARAAMTEPIAPTPIGVVHGGRSQICEDHWGAVVARRFAHQLIGQLLIDQRPAGWRTALGFAGHHRSVVHRVSFREPPFLRLIVRPRHLHSR